jgi:Tfp pilus assembly protein PilN
MRFDINLASQPYEDARAVYLRWGGALAIVAVLTVALLGFAVYQWRSTRESANKSSELRREITRLERERGENQTILNRPENRSTRERSQFINGLIVRKSFSWTQVFADLEKAMPARVHLLSITPELKEGRQIEIKMRIAGDSREKALDLARRLEQSRRFRDAQVTGETANVQGGSDKVEMQISAFYVPDTGGL